MVILIEQIPPSGNYVCEGNPPPIFFSTALLKSIILSFFMLTILERLYLVLSLWFSSPPYSTLKWEEIVNSEELLGLVAFFRFCVYFWIFMIF